MFQRKITNSDYKIPSIIILNFFFLLKKGSMKKVVSFHKHFLAQQTYVPAVQ